MEFQQVEILIIEKGMEFEMKTAELMPGVKLEVYHDSEAALYLGQTNVIDFPWNDYAKEIFENLDTCEPIELLWLLSQNMGYRV